MIMPHLSLNLYCSFFLSFSRFLNLIGTNMTMNGCIFCNKKFCIYQIRLTLLPTETAYGRYISY